MAGAGQRYAGKVTIVSGGARGIGKGVVEKFARHGSHVVFADILVDEGKQLEAALNDEKNGTVKFVKCDVTVETELKNLVETTVELYGTIDCAIGVAGYHPPLSTIDEFSAEAFQALMTLNVTHYLLLAKFSLPYLRKSKGSIIFTSSLIATIGQRGAVMYDATKGAITSMTRTLAIDESKYGVRVNSVSPSAIITPLAEEFMGTLGLKDPKGYFGSYSLLNRMGEVGEVADGYLYLAADATFSTGTDLPITGGTELGFSPKD